MFIALRRFTLVCTILLERFLLNKVHDKATVGAIAVMVGGAQLGTLRPTSASASQAPHDLCPVCTAAGPGLGTAESPHAWRARAGAVVAAATDLSFTLYGYSAVLGNDVLTALCALPLSAHAQDSPGSPVPKL